MSAPNIGELVASTARKWGKGLGDQVTNDNGFLQYLRDNNKIMVCEDGGRVINERLMYNDNGNTSAQWFEGYDTFSPQTDYEIMDAAEFQWRQLGALVTISTREEMINRGPQQLAGLLKFRLKHATTILGNMLATSLFSDGSTAKQLAGLRSLVADDPTTSSSVGGINQYAYSWWRNYYSAAAATTSSNITSRMNLAHISIKRGADVPTLWVCDDTMYTYYEESLQPLQRITTTKEADAGYLALRYKKSPVIYDDQCPDKHMYALNLNDLWLRKMDEEMFAVGDSVQVANAMYKVVPITMMGQLTTNRRASHGVIIAS